MVAIARDMEQLCPRAMMLNYTNPMAMLCHAMQRETATVSTGLCHSVQGTSAMLARWAGVKPEDVDYVCAGINHTAWFTKFEHKGKDLYPKLRKLVAETRNDRNIIGYYISDEPECRGVSPFYLRSLYLALRELDPNVTTPIDALVALTALRERLSNSGDS